MSPSDSSYDRLILVSSLYGPGAVGGWLCIVMSVFVTWTLDLGSRHRDSITNDFIAALSMPTFAACHVFYLLATTNSSMMTEWSQRDRTRLLTTSTPASVQYAAAVEAPLVICDTFSVLALILFAIAAIRRFPRRVVAVLVAGILAFSTETTIFAQTSGIAVVESNLARPFLFNFFEIMVTILVILCLSLLGLTALVAYSVPKLLFTSRQQAGRPDANIGHELQDLADEEILQMQPDNEAMALPSHRGARRLYAMVPLITILAILSAIGGPSVSAGSGILGMTQVMQSFSWGERLLFFIPKTSVSILDIDQLAALSGGLCTLAFSLWDAFKSRKEWLLGQTGTDVEINRRIRVEVERETRRQRILLARRFNELETVQIRLDEGAADPEERRDLLSRRQQLQQELGSLIDISPS
ncbi:hypothetical protein V8F33_000770 [Rhypophila sp. PSN 637]